MIPKISVLFLYYALTFPVCHPISAEETSIVRLGITMVQIPAGSFTIGSNNGRENEKPVHRVTLDIFGTEGSLHVPVLNAGVMTVRTREGERTEKHPPYQNIHKPLIDDFTRAVLDDREPGVGGDTGREVNRIEEEIFSDREG